MGIILSTDSITIEFNCQFRVEITDSRLGTILIESRQGHPLEGFGKGLFVVISREVKK